MSSINKIIVVRHDKIGDFVLTWPAFYLLKKGFPEAQIDVFVAPVMKSFAQACPYIDNVIVDTGDDKAIASQFIEQHYDIGIALHSQHRIAKLFKQAKIPYTIGPKLNWYQFLYHDRASIKYKKGEPCWRGNVMLVEHLLTKFNRPIPDIEARLWNVDNEKCAWQKFYGKKGNELLIFVHVGSGGSSASLPLEMFAQLIRKVSESAKHKTKFVLTYSGDEKQLVIELLSLLKDDKIDAIMATALDSLVDFAKSLVAADMFIAGSTGPLHLAGLHNVPTVGFYAGRRSAPKIRWQTLSEESRRLAYTPPIGRKTGRDMSLVDIDEASQGIVEFLNKHD